VKKLRQLLKVLPLILVGVSACIGILVLVQAAGPSLWSEKGAGWAQAILTTAGIAFALYTAQGAQQHVENLKREDLKQKRQGVLAIANAAFDNIRAVDLDATQGRLHFFFEETYYPGYFAHALAALRAIPLHELLSYNMTVGVLDIVNVLTRIERFCEAHSEGADNWLSLEEAYYLKNSEKLSDAIRAFNFIQGGAQGLSTEEIERQNGASDPADF